MKAKWTHVMKQIQRLSKLNNNWSGIYFSCTEVATSEDDKIKNHKTLHCVFDALCGLSHGIAALTRDPHSQSDLHPGFSASEY